MTLGNDSYNEEIEEETLPNYNPLDFYPIRIGEILVARYRIVGKLGFGANSTVWLARDMEYGSKKPNILTTTIDDRFSGNKFTSLLKSMYGAWVRR